MSCLRLPKLDTKSYLLHKTIGTWTMQITLGTRCTPTNLHMVSMRPSLLLSRAARSPCGVNISMTTTSSRWSGPVRSLWLKDCGVQYHTTPLRRLHRVCKFSIAGCSTEALMLVLSTQLTTVPLLGFDQSITSHFQQ